MGSGRVVGCVLRGDGEYSKRTSEWRPAGEADGDAGDGACADADAKPECYGAAAGPAADAGGLYRHGAEAGVAGAAGTCGWIYSEHADGRGSGDGADRGMDGTDERGD